MASGRHDQPRAANSVLVELLDDNAVEERPQLVANALERLVSGSRAHAPQDIRGVRLGPSPHGGQPWRNRDFVAWVHEQRSPALEETAMPETPTASERITEEVTTWPGIE